MPYKDKTKRQESQRQYVGRVRQGIDKPRDRQQKDRQNEAEDGNLSIPQLDSISSIRNKMEV